jgi:hypothetical protein
MIISVSTGKGGAFGKGGGFGQKGSGPAGQNEGEWGESGEKDGDKPTENPLEGLLRIFFTRVRKTPAELGVVREEEGEGDSRVLFLSLNTLLKH